MDIKRIFEMAEDFAKAHKDVSTSDAFIHGLSVGLTARMQKMWTDITKEKPGTGMYLVHERWPNGHPFCLLAEYDADKDEWRPWEDIDVAGMPLDEVQRSMITHWMPVVMPEREDEE